jgi:hypothetical protein
MKTRDPEQLIDLIHKRRAGLARDAAASAEPVTDELRARALLALIATVRQFPGDAAARERLHKIVDLISREQPSFRGWVERLLASPSPADDGGARLEEAFLPPLPLPRQ